MLDGAISPPRCLLQASSRMVEPAGIIHIEYHSSKFCTPSTAHILSVVSGVYYPERGEIAGGTLSLTSAQSTDSHHHLVGTSENLIGRTAHRGISYNQTKGGINSILRFRSPVPVWTPLAPLKVEESVYTHPGSLKLNGSHLCVIANLEENDITTIRSDAVYSSILTSLALPHRMNHR
jgi:hypothetical protein